VIAPKAFTLGDRSRRRTFLPVRPPNARPRTTPVHCGGREPGRRPR
jgi:hypothetical protein